MIEYEGNKLEDFISEHLTVYKEKESNKEDLQALLNKTLQEVETMNPNEVPDKVIDKTLKKLMGKKFIGSSSIGLPMLSGLLSMRLPDHFALIDAKVLEAIYKLKDEEFFPKSLKSLVLKKWQNMRYKNKQLKKINRKDYINYLKIVKGLKVRIQEGVLSKEFELNDIENALYAFNKYSQRV